MVRCSNVHSPSSVQSSFLFIHQKSFVCPSVHVSSVSNSIRLSDSDDRKSVNQTRKRKNFKMNFLNSFSSSGFFLVASSPILPPVPCHFISSYFIHVRAIIVIVFMCFKLKFDLLTMNVPTRHKNSLLKALNPIFLFPSTTHNTER